MSKGLEGGVGYDYGTCNGGPLGLALGKVAVAVLLVLERRQTFPVILLVMMMITMTIMMMKFSSAWW